MNKKRMGIAAVIIAVAVLASPVQALTVKFGGSIGYRTVSDSLIKDIYKPGGIQAGGFIGLGLGQMIELRAEIGTFKLNGTMLGSEENLTLSLAPITAGVRLQFLNSALRPYVGAGAAFIKYEEKYPERIGTVAESVSGFYGEGGLYLYAGRHFFLDANVRYLSAKADGLDGKVELGGIRAGLGLGLKF